MPHQRNCLNCFYRLWVLVGLLLAGGGASMRAEIQFDVFPGFGSVIRESSWNPVAFEIFNDGPSFHGTVELSLSQFGGNHMHRFEVELPTNTRKRFHFTVFNNTRYPAFHATLLDERDKKRAEQSLSQIRTAAWNGQLLGAMPRTIAGLPRFPEFNQGPELDLGKVVRVNLEHFPENPIALDALDALYLNPSVAVEMNPKQVEALMSWIHAGGHLILSVDSALEINSSPWLKSICPILVESVENRRIGPALQYWLRSRPADLGSIANRLSETSGLSEVQRLYGAVQTPSIVAPASPFSNLAEEASFSEAEMPTVTGILRPSAMNLVESQGHPVMTAHRLGSGQVTALCFPTEREPFRSWAHRDWFWAKLIEVPEMALTNQRPPNHSPESLDGVFGALIDSRQVQKLPVKWLLAILVAYLVVIGPLDHYWLKRINRQILTWITFPIYVIFFSFLIYFIGYKLRAGETEWNEIQVVDVLEKRAGAELRGRSFFSIYSPVNKRYPVASDFSHTALRGEFEGLWGSGQGSGQSTFRLRESGFDADVYVPVWSSQMYVCDWVSTGDLPIEARIVAGSDGWQLRLLNRLNRPLNPVRLFWGDVYFELDTLDPNEERTVDLKQISPRQTRNFVAQHSSRFQNAIRSRRSSVGNTASGQLNDPKNETMAASLSGEAKSGPQGVANFVNPHGFDLTSWNEQGVPFLMAWDEGSTCVDSIKRFAANRETFDTLYRIPIAIQPTSDKTP